MIEPSDIRTFLVFGTVALAAIIAFRWWQGRGASARTRVPPLSANPSIPDDVDRLTTMFRLAGLSNPEWWARSELHAEVSQLHCYLFMRQMWREIVTEGDDAWIDEEVAYATQKPSGPHAGVGHALRLLLDQGADRQALVDVVRGMQVRLLFRFCYLLDDPSFEESELAGVGWRLVETDENFNPTERPICGLHELVLETDPTGREMRPRGAFQQC